MTNDVLFQKVNPKNKDEMEKLSQSQGISQVDEGYLKLMSKRFLRNRIATVGLIVFVLLIIVAIFAPFIAPYDPNLTLGPFEMAPNGQFLLGTDEIGRDVLSRVIYGSRISLYVGLMSVFIYTIIGTTLGMMSGFLGGIWDAIIMRITEVFMSFPYFMVVIVIVSLVGPSIHTVTLVIALLGWPATCRLVRGQVMKLKKADYIQAAVASGYSLPEILFKHIFPNVLSPILVNMTFGVATSILTEASLSFLGVGVTAPNASWGNMLTNAQSLSALSSQPWRWVPPGIAILITVLAVNFMGDGVRGAVEGDSK